MSKETVVLRWWGVLQIPHKIHIKEKKYNYFELNSHFLSHYKFYPANSWCLLRRTRDKPLGETVCFSIEYARVLRAHVDRLEKLPSKEQQLSRTQHFILSSHAAMFVLHTQYDGPCGIPLTPMIRQQNYLLSTHSRRMHLTFSFVRCECLYNDRRLNAKFLPKSGGKRMIQTWLKYYLDCGQNLKPKFKAFLPSLVRDC